jgi:hypothetical protein
MRLLFYLNCSSIGRSESDHASVSSMRQSPSYRLTKLEVIRTGYQLTLVILD